MTGASEIRRQIRRLTGLSIASSAIALVCVTVVVLTELRASKWVPASHVLGLSEFVTNTLSGGDLRVASLSISVPSSKVIVRLDTGGLTMWDGPKSANPNQGGITVDTTGVALYGKNNFAHLTPSALDVSADRDGATEFASLDANSHSMSGSAAALSFGYWPLKEGASAPKDGTWIGRDGIRLTDGAGHIRAQIGRSVLIYPNSGNELTTSLASIALFGENGALTWRMPATP